MDKATGRASALFLAISVLLTLVGIFWSPLNVKDVEIVWDDDIGAIREALNRDVLIASVVSSLLLVSLKNSKFYKVSGFLLAALALVFIAVDFF